MDIDLRWDKLPAQEICYDDDKTDILLFSGGLGCVSEKTILHTTNGDVAVGDILSPQVYFSRNRQGQPSLFPGTVPYPKEKGILYRVIHEHGEFEAHGSHRICVGGDRYQSLDEVALQFSRQSFLVPSVTNQEFSRLRSFLDDPCLSQIVEDFLCHYGDCIHQYGQRLQMAVNSDQYTPPLPFDAHKFDRIFQGLSSTFHMDDQEGCTLKRNHLFGLIDLFCMLDYTFLQAAPALAFLNEGFLTKSFGHILWGIRQFQQSPLTSLFRHLAQISDQHCTLPLGSSCTKTTSRIVAIEKKKKEWFWDLHVFGSNNYLAHGMYHHNSGKTYYLCRKALKLSILNRGHAGGFLVPAFSDFRRDVLPTFESIFEAVGMIKNTHYWFHETHKEFRFVWNKRPLYILTAEKPIAGPNLAYCLINEFSLVPWVRINEMIRRVRVKEAKYKQKCLAGTPEDIHGWLEDFVEQQEARNEKNPNAFKIVYSDTAENTFIDENYRETLEGLLDEQSLKVFASGQIVRLGGEYFYYAFQRKVNVAPNTEDKSELVHVGLDFNVGKMAATFSHLRYIDGKKTLFVFGELLLEGDSDTLKMGRAIITRFGLGRVIITCDASGKSRKTSGRSDVQTLHSLGFSQEQVRYKAANPRLRERQILVNGLLSHGQIIVDPSCKKTIKDFEKVQQNKVDYSKVKDKDDKLTHLSDGLDYLIDWEFQVNFRRSKTIQL